MDPLSAIRWPSTPNGGSNRFATPGSGRAGMWCGSSRFGFCRLAAPFLHRHYPTSTVLRASPPPHLARPVPRGCPVGLALDHVIGLPVLRLPSSSTHAVTNTPAEPQTAFRSLSIVTTAFPVLTLRPACSPSSLKNPLHQRLQPLRYLHDCSSCYRPERKLPGAIQNPLEDSALAGRTSKLQLK
jgi:hypothetical protein